VASSRDCKIEKIKMFMNALLEIGFIIRGRKNSRHFELYCGWAGGTIARIRIGRGRVLVVCINPAIRDSPEMLQKIIAYAKDLL
jgi:hypothetical protein